MTPPPTTPRGPGTCKAKTEVYSRVVGFYTPVDQWNPGKRAEYKDRKPFKISGKILEQEGTCHE